LNASTAGIEEVLDKDKLVYGIDCERCHGAALNHVNFHLDNPGRKEGKYIVRFADLARQQKLDACAVCHSGNNKMQERSTFKFRPGDTLSHYFVVWPSKETDSNFDVHGNQYQLLSQSKCFIGSKLMDCSTCHDPHANAGTDMKTYSNVCMSCHKGVTHSFARDAMAAQQLVNNCIDCHMPAQPSRAITFQVRSNGPKLAYLLRTHRIAVYEKK
jgi:predicted CXXCH cytochrome family protein